MSRIFLNPDYDPIALLLMFLAGAWFGWLVRGFWHRKDAAHIEMLQQELARMTQMRGNETKEARLAENEVFHELLASEPPREEGKHRFLAGTCVDSGHPFDEICTANLGNHILNSLGGMK